MLTEIKTIPETFFVARPNLFSRKYYFRLENKKNVMDDFVQSNIHGIENRTRYIMSCCIHCFAEITATYCGMSEDNCHPLWRIRRFQWWGFVTFSIMESRPEKDSKFIKKRPQHGCFLVNIAKFSRTPILMNISKPVTNFFRNDMYRLIADTDSDLAL